MKSLADKITVFQPPFGDTDTQKTMLEAESELLKQRLEGQIDNFKTDATRVGKQALVIGGSVMAVYLLLDWLLPNDDEAEITPHTKPQVEASQPSWLVKSVSAYAITWLLGIAREKLMDFLATQPSMNTAVNDKRPTSEI
jgi:hypothetical protein